MRTITILSCVVLRKVKLPSQVIEVVSTNEFFLVQQTRPLDTNPTRVNSISQPNPCETVTVELDNEKVIEFILALFLLAFLVWQFQLNIESTYQRTKRQLGLTKIVPDDKRVHVNIFLLPEVESEVVSVHKKIPSKPNNPHDADVNVTNSKEDNDKVSVRVSGLIDEVSKDKKPERIVEGNVSLVYKLFDKADPDKAAAIFKPTGKVETADAESDVVISSEEHVLNEVLAYEMDQNVQHLGLSAGVPKTELTSILRSFLDMGVDKEKEVQDDMEIEGSIQQYVNDSESCEDYGPSIFSKEDVHKIGLLDLRILNCDRHSGNILLTSKRELVPIDHALSFPSIFAKETETQNETDTKTEATFDLSLERVSFDWLMFPQAKQNFTEDSVKAISNIKIEDDLKVMENMGYTIGQKLAVAMSTKLLQVGVCQYGKTLFDLGKIIQRDFDRKQQSTFERLVNDALKEVIAAKVEDGDALEVKKVLVVFERLAHEYFLQM